jgi:hypothetical protein
MSMTAKSYPLVPSMLKSALGCWAPLEKLEQAVAERDERRGRRPRRSRIDA